MARAKAGINAPLTQFQPVVPGNQAEQEVILLTLPFTTVPLRDASVLLHKPGCLASQYATNGCFENIIDVPWISAGLLSWIIGDIQSGII